MADIDLGFVEQREAGWLTNRYFPSKVGGRPAWLELDMLPSKEQLLCGKCRSPMSFLCQIYAPHEAEHNFHRTIYVFICRQESCNVPNDASNLLVLRSQLPLKNRFYSEEPPSEEGDPLPPVSLGAKLCVACGCSGPLKCGRCKKANYCSAQHQRAHWKQHKVVCSAQSEGEEAVPRDEPLTEIVFPEWEVVVEPNSTSGCEATKHKDDDGGQEDELSRLAEFEKMVAAGKTGEFQDVSDAELSKYTRSAEAVDDKHFRKFKKEYMKDPEQILRYKRNGQPLWMADVAKTVADQLSRIPKCEHCGGEREFEFQIMPQMLNLLKDSRLDWGVLAVYTCARSCAIPAHLGYVEEFVIKQDLLGGPQPLNL